VSASLASQIYSQLVLAHTLLGLSLVTSCVRGFHGQDCEHDYELAHALGCSTATGNHVWNHGALTGNSSLASKLLPSVNEFGHLHVLVTG